MELENDCLTSRLLLQQGMCIFKGGLSSLYDGWAKYKKKVPDVQIPIKIFTITWTSITQGVTK